nr:eukaryotic peptide chain release factor subunit 1-like [Ziziphus jujuba var. spinosa]
MADIQEYNSERHIEKWKMKKLTKKVEAASGRGVRTRTMFSLLIPPGDRQISRAIRTMEDEFKTASDMAQSVPPNGFALYIGNVVTEKNGVVTIIIDFEPFKPINGFMCIYDDKFHTEALDELLQSDDEKFGFIVMDGESTGYVRVPMYHPEPIFYTTMKSSKILSNGKFVQERRLIRQLIKEREQNANKCVVGFDETLKALEMGDVNILVL